MNKNRRLGLVVAPALLSAMVLSGCQDEAPTASAPSAPAQSTQTQEQGSSSQSQSSPSTTESSSSSTSESSSPTTESSSSSSSSSSDSSGSSGKCKNTSSFAFERGDVQPKPLNTEQEFKTSAGAVKISFGQPTVNSSGGDSYFPGDGMETVIYPVTMKASGSYWIAARLKFGLADESGETCKSDTLGAVLPRGEAVEVKSMRGGDTYSAKIAFAVPAGADLSKYSVLFAEEYSSGEDADLAWNGK